MFIVNKIPEFPISRNIYFAIAHTHKCTYWSDGLTLGPFMLAHIICSNLHKLTQITASHQTQARRFKCPKSETAAGLIFPLIGYHSRGKIRQQFPKKDNQPPNRIQLLKQTR